MFTMMIVMESVSKNCDIYDYVEQAWCGIYGMAPSIQAQHVVAVTIPTIAVIFLTYLWYKKRSNSVTRGRSDPGGGGGTSKKRNRHRTGNSNGTVAAIVGNADRETSPVSFPEEMENAMQKAIRDLETAAPIQEISDVEEMYAEREAGVEAPSNDGEVENSRIGEENSNVATSRLVADDDQITSLSKDIVSESAAVEETVCKQVKSELSSSALGETSSTSDHDAKKDVATVSEDGTREASSVAEADGCEWKVQRSTTSPTTTASCCALQQRAKHGGATAANGVGDRSGRGGVHHKEKNVAMTINEDLDVAMQKLESMRISGADKTPKRKSTTKRQNAKDAATPSTEDKANQTSGECGVKTSTIASQATSPAPSSKAKKRKSRKKAKLTNGNNSDESTCKAQTDEGSDGDAKNTCDSIKNYDVCVDRTDKAKCAYTSRARVPENERMYINSHDDDSLRCSIKKTDDCDRKVVENHQQEDCDNERDSANHSPVDNILDSQSVHFSDAHSEGSSDSGKGCSEGAMSPSPQTPAGGSSISGDQNMVLLFQFVIPQEHVGKLIGRHGQFINNIKTTSNTRIYIKKHPTSYKKKICALEGTQQEINKALELIRNRFPEDAYPDVTLEEFPISLPIACPLRPELFQLDLVEGVNNDVVISSVVSAGHLFLQQPMHPSYQSLTLLNISMNQVYNSPEAPLVLKPVKDNIVAAPAMDGWYRAQIVSVNEGTEACEVRFLDYGGYLSLNTSCLRAVRADFLTLPFQAVECFLANVSPINGTWCEDAKLVVQGLTYGQILQAQVYDYTPEGIPLILLYAVHGSQVILINQELVARGFAFPTLPNEGGAQTDEYYVYS